MEGRSLGFPSSWSTACYEKGQRGVKGFPSACFPTAGVHTAMDLHVPWVKNSGDLVIPKAAVSFGVEFELVSENKLVTGIWYTLPSPERTARVWNDWVNEKAYGKVKRAVGVMGDFLNLVIGLRESSGRNEAGRRYVEIKRSHCFLHNKFQNTFSANIAENDKTHKYGEVWRMSSINLRLKGKTEVKRRCVLLNIKQKCFRN